MNNPNPFVPKGSLLEQQSLRRSRLKIAVGCALAVSVTGLVVMLIQGCKREQPTPGGDMGSTTPPDTSAVATASSNVPPTDTNSNSMAAAPVNPTPAASPSPTPGPTPAPAPTPTPAPMAVTPPVEPAAPAAGSEYVVAQGDTLAKIAKAQGVSLKALEAANPGVDPKKLKIKQKLVIPAKSADATAAATPGAPGAAVAPEATGANYTVKSGDTLSKIAKRHGISLKELRAANNLTTDHIKVGQKLTIPSKAEAAATPTAAPDTSAPAPMTPTPAPAPVVPAPAPNPAPGQH